MRMNCISRSEFAKSRIIIFDELVVMIIYGSKFFLESQDYEMSCEKKLLISG